MILIDVFGTFLGHRHAISTYNFISIHNNMYGIVIILCLSSRPLDCDKAFCMVIIRLPIPGRYIKKFLMS